MRALVADQPPGKPRCHAATATAGNRGKLALPKAQTAFGMLAAGIDDPMPVI